MNGRGTGCDFPNINVSGVIFGVGVGVGVFFFFYFMLLARQNGDALYNWGFLLDQEFCGNS